MRSIYWKCEKRFQYWREWLRFQVTKEPLGWLTFFSTVIGLGIAFFSFVYPNIIVPMGLSPHVNTSCELTRAAERNGFTAFYGTVSVENVSSSRVYVTASWFQLVGAKYRLSETLLASQMPKDGEPKINPYWQFVNKVIHNQSGQGSLKNDSYKQVPNGYLDVGSYIPISHYTRSISDDLLDCGKVLDRNDWLDPGEKTRVQFVAYVPSDEYDQLQMFSAIFVTKDNNTSNCFTKIYLNGGGKVKFDTEYQTGPFWWRHFVKAGAINASDKVAIDDELRSCPFWWKPFAQGDTHPSEDENDVTESSCRYDVSLWSTSNVVQSIKKAAKKG